MRHLHLHRLRLPSARLPSARLLCAGLLGAALLSACGSVSTGNAGSGTLDTTTTSKADVMTFRPSSLPVAYLGEAYRAQIGVTGGVGPYGYRVSAGTLPPGLRFERGTLSGTPSKSGTYTFSVEATDANLSTRVQQYTLNVDALPPLSLQPTLPPSEIRGETRIPLTIKAPRTARAARLSWDLGSGVQVTRVQPGDPGSILFWQQKGTVLTLDIGFRSVPRSESRVAMITVKPTGAVRLKAEALGYEARDGAGKLLAERKRPGTETAAPAAEKSAADPKATEQKVTEQKATEQKAADPKAAEQKPAQPAPASQPATTPPVTTQPTEPAPADVETSPLPSPALPTPAAPAPTPPAPTPPTGTETR